VADFGSPDTAVQKFTANGTFIAMWGSTGLADGEFINSSGIVVDSKNNVFVGDYGENNRIQKFDKNGNFITKWGSTGTGDGQFQSLIGIRIDSKGLVYVADSHNSRVQIFALSRSR
jgi:tripartite motif-containing protein 71